jgi:hypothetical protein
VGFAVDQDQAYVDHYSSAGRARSLAAPSPLRQDSNASMRQGAIFGDGIISDSNASMLQGAIFGDGIISAQQRSPSMLVQAAAEAKARRANKGRRRFAV